MKTVDLGGRLIGRGQPCFIAAEVGINHNGDVGLAHRLIDAAADAGADAVKFQSYRTEDFLSDETLSYEYESEGRKRTESQFAMFKRNELTSDQLAELQSHCEDRGVVFFSTPTSVEGVAELARTGSRLLKNGSDFLVHLPVIRAMAETGLPTVLSTGMATLGEIDDAVRAFRDAGGTDLVLLHCTSSYPAPAEDVHLRKIPTLASAFGCPVGFSDHTDGVSAAVASIPLGSCFLEKHFTLDRSLPGPDHRFSADPAELLALVSAVRAAESMLGDSAVGPSESEAEGRLNFRLSCVAARDLRAGQQLTEGDVAFRRPGTGLAPKANAWLIGRALRIDVPAGTVFEPGHFA
jgi:N,N'-diacetyllegionaminate synthase